jgi:hypothetical protein
MLWVFTVALIWGTGTVIWWFLRSIFDWFRGEPKPEPIDEDEELRQAMEVVTRPRLVVGGQYMHWRCTAEPCDPPMLPNTIDVHDTTDPKHNPKTCRHCNRKPGYSGVSYRSN